MGGRMMKYFLLLYLLLGSANAATNKQVSTQEILLGHITTPANPAAGKSKVYAKSDNLLYILTSGGSESRVGSGDFVGPASSTDEAVCRFDGTTGKLAQNSAATINDTGKGTFVGLLDSTLTASRALVSDGSKNLTSSATTATELGYVNGVTSAIQTQIDGKQATDSDLTALAGNSTDGLWAHTGAGTGSARTITGTANQITVTNGNGVSGNPTLSIPSDPTFPGTSTTVNGISYMTGTADPTVTATSAAAGSLYTNTTTGTIYRKTDAGSSTNWSIIGTSAAVTGFTSYTPTFTGFGTVVTQAFYYRQVGDSLEIHGRFTGATVTAVEPRISVPTNCTVSSNYTTLEIAGDFGRGANAAATYYTTIEPSSTYFTVSAQSSGSHSLTKVASASATFANSENYSLKALVKCSNLASVVNTATTPVITAYTAYTPTFTGFGTVSTQSFYYRQVGDTVQVHGRFITGTVTGTEARVSLPTVCSSSSSTYSTFENAGTWVRSATATSHGGLVLIEPSVTYVTFSDVNTFGGGSAGVLAKQNGNASFGNTDTVVLNFSIRCAGMPGVIPAPNLVGFNTNNGTSAIRVEGASLAAPSAGACAVTEVGGSDWINGNCTSGATGVCTCTLNAGIFSAAPKCQISIENLAAGNSRDEQITSTSTSTIVTFTATSGGTAVNNDVFIMCMGAR